MRLRRRFLGAGSHQLYAQAFEQAGRLDRLEAFASFHGADFYGLPRNTGSVTLERKPWTVPACFPFGAGEVVPMCAGECLDSETP